MELTDADKSMLLLSARESILSLLQGSPSPAIDYSSFPDLEQKCGAFVTLTMKNKLRGCIGYIVSENSLFDTIIEAARQAAFSDPRFFPVTSDEIQDIDIEISILSPMESLNDYNDITIGKDGLFLDEHPRAVLLPQVAVEHKYDTPHFLSALCQKAGLEHDEWRKRKLKLKTFTSLVFSESEEKKKLYEQL
jgi:AmmeMemoRadiSam system protein A